MSRKRLNSNSIECMQQSQIRNRKSISVSSKGCSKVFICCVLSRALEYVIRQTELGSGSGSIVSFPFEPELVTQWLLLAHSDCSAIDNHNNHNVNNGYGNNSNNRNSSNTTTPAATPTPTVPVTYAMMLQILNDCMQGKMFEADPNDNSNSNSNYNTNISHNTTSSGNNSSISTRSSKVDEEYSHINPMDGTDGTDGMEGTEWNLPSTISSVPLPVPLPLPLPGWTVFDTHNASSYWTEPKQFFTW